MATRRSSTFRWIATATLAGALAAAGAAAAFAPAAPQAAGAWDLAAGVALAQALTRAQAAQLGLDGSEAPAMPGHDLPSEALAALAARHGVAPSASDLARLGALDALPAAQRAALAGMVDAFLALEDAARGAVAGARLGGWAVDANGGLAEGSPEALEAHLATLPADVGLDLGPVLAARNQLLDAVVRFHDAWAGAPAPDAPVPGPLVVAPAFILDLAGGSDVHALDVALLLDVGGHDTYLNNAGGARANIPGLLGCPTASVLEAAALVDLAGNDVHRNPRPCGVHGGAAGGAGVLVDAAGLDTYHGGSHGVNGGAALGAGFLLDAGGKDDYGATSAGVNGGGYLHGAGMLLDLGWDDTYTSAGLGANGGAYGYAAGALVDAGGADVYATGGSGGNGGAVLGAGLLADLGGNDRYVGGSFGVNGGGYLGAGALLDWDGRDTYAAGSFATNGGGAGGLGLLLDRGGNDAYAAGTGAVNGGAAGACAPVLAACAAHVPTGIGLLLDGSGTDAYLDADGGTGTDRSVVGKGPFGAQVDTCFPTLPAGQLVALDPSAASLTLAPLAADACIPALGVPAVAPLGVGVPSARVPGTCEALALAGSAACTTDTAVPVTPPRALCDPLGALLCLGLPGINLGSVPALCRSAALAALCIPGVTVGGGRIVTLPGVNPTGLTPALGLSVRPSALRVEADPHLGEQQPAGPVGVVVPVPLLGEPLQLVLCPQGCPLPVLPEASAGAGLAVGIGVNGVTVYTLAVPVAAEV